MTVRVDDRPASAIGATAKVTIAPRRRSRRRPATVPIGADQDDRRSHLDHAGPTVFELEVEARPRELTLANNRAVVVVNGVRDRLRVLLVSGEPHPGERIWRNLLKSDPSVDLVHFTILRPPEKQDGTPINELSLIAFPIRELFEVKLNEFDLIIFDRYRRRGILPHAYLREHRPLRRGRRRAARGRRRQHSPAAQPLSARRSATSCRREPTGEVFEQGFQPAVTAVGQRHPVTADLPARPATKPTWGRWFRQVARHRQDAATP